MRHRWFILVAVLLLVLIGGAVAAFAYDSSREDLIAEGVTVAGVDVGGMSTDEALQASREGSIFSRVARDITGGEEDAQVSARVSYSTDAVEQLVERVEGKLNRPARDAEVDFPSLEKVKEQRGRKVKSALLEQRIAQALTVPGVKRSVKAPVRIIKPKVTQAELADKYPVLLIADRYNFKL